MRAGDDWNAWRRLLLVQAMGSEERQLIMSSIGSTSGTAAKLEVRAEVTGAMPVEGQLGMPSAGQALFCQRHDRLTYTVKLLTDARDQGLHHNHISRLASAACTH